jgi:hypothetical protein
LFFGGIEILGEVGVEPFVQETDMQWDTPPVTHQPELVEVTEVAVSVIQFNSIIGKCVFGHIFEGGKVGVEGSALALFGKDVFVTCLPFDFGS